MKTYIQPEMKVVFVKTTHICTTSLGVTSTPKNNISGDVHTDNSWDIWGNNDLDEE